MTSAATQSLTDWLLGCIEAAEKAARQADAISPAPWRRSEPPFSSAAGYLSDAEGVAVAHTAPVFQHFIGMHDPARVLAQCAAHRAIVRHHLPTSQGTFCISCSDIDVPPPNNVEPYPCPTLRALASIWRDRDGWREEWA